MDDIFSQIKWLVADWHFGERRLDLLCRPFDSTEDHDETLIFNHNRWVAPDDVVLCVGDVTNKEAPDSLHLVERLNGKKILIRGNHDEAHSDSELAKYFIHIIGNGDGLKFEYQSLSLYATHYPTQGLSDRFNVVGHVHGTWRCQLNMLNVGVDNFGYSPCHISRIPFFVDAITNHYDRDVWVAYENVNAAFRGFRGSGNRYLPSAPSQ
jgi:calcineurin-like phosphoesterase family protein